MKNMSLENQFQSLHRSTASIGRLYEIGSDIKPGFWRVLGGHPQKCLFRGTYNQVYQWLDARRMEELR